MKGNSIEATPEEIREWLGFDVTPAKGFMITVRVFEREETSKGGIVIPNSIRAEDRFSSMVGRVVSIGPEAHTGDKYKDGRKPSCVLGEWVLYARNAGPQFCQNGIPFCTLPEDKLYNGPIEDPAKITRDTL